MMNVELKKIYLAILGIAISGQILSNDKIGNGGDVVLCAGRNAQILDYYEASLKRVGGETYKVIDVDKMKRDEVVDYVVNKLSAYPGLKLDLVEALNKIGNVSDWIESESAVSEISDSQEAYVLPPQCKLLQIAVRQNQTVFVAPEATNKISDGQLGVLSLHESIYFLGAEKKHVNSIKSRNLLAGLLKLDLPKSKLDVLVEDFESLKGKNEEMKCVIDNFHLAVYDGNLPYVKMCIDEGVYVDSRNGANTTPLYVATERLHIPVVKYLISKNASIKALDLLEVAVKNNSKDLVDILLKAGSESQKDILRIAVDNNNAEIVKVLVSKGYSSYYALEEAINDNNMALVSYFIDNKVEVTIDNLFSATNRNSNHEILELLLKNYKKHIGTTKLLAEAVKNNDLKKMEILVEYGSFVNYQDKDSDLETALFKASSKEAIDFLLKNGALIDVKNISGKTLLAKYADAKYSNLFEIEMIKYLVKKGASIHAVDRYGKTPLMLAIARGSLEAVKIFMESGSSLYAQDFIGRSPLMLATKNNFHEIMKMLITKDRNHALLEDKDGRNALFYIAGRSEHKYKDEYGNDLTITVNGSSSLNSSSAIESYKILIMAKLNLNHETRSGQSVLEFVENEAYIYNKNEVIDFLKSKNARY